MDQRTPLKDLTTDNICENQEVTERFLLSSRCTALKPRISIIRDFDPLYESPLRVVSDKNFKYNDSKSTVIPNHLFNNENFDPFEKLSLSNLCEKTIREDITEFAEGIIIEAINTIFPDANHVHINNTIIYETDEAENPDNTSTDACNLYESVIENNSFAKENVDNTFDFFTCNEDTKDQFEREDGVQLCEDDLQLSKEVELLNNDSKQNIDIDTMCKDDSNTFNNKDANTDNNKDEYINNLKENCEANKDLQKTFCELETMCKNKDEDIHKLKEECEANKNLQKTLCDLETMCKNKDEYIHKLKEECEGNKHLRKTICDLETICKNKDEYITKLKEECEANVDLSKSICNLKTLCNNKDEYIIQLKDEFEKEKTQHMKELNTFKEICTKNIDMQENITELKNSCMKKDEQLEKLKEEFEILKLKHEKEINSLNAQANDKESEGLLGLQSTSTEKDDRISELEATIHEQEKKFNMAMNSFEESIQSQLCEIKSLQNENILAKRHLSNLEIAFSDLHQKYEKSKRTVEGYKSNEDLLQSTLHIFEDNLKKYDEQLQLIKKKAIEQITGLNKDLLEVKENTYVEVSKLSSKIKHLEIKNTSLTNALEQKTQECQDLTNLCEEVTGKGFYK